MNEITKASKSTHLDVEKIPTGMPQLSRIMSGGWPLRRISQVSGPPSIGKTTLSFLAIHEAQELGLDTLFVDFEYSFDEAHARSCGVDLDKLDLLQPRFAEDGLDAIEEYLEKHPHAYVVMDSIGGILPRAEAEKDSSGRTIGAQAGLIARFCRKVVPILSMRNSGILALNHEYTDIMSGKVNTSGGAKLQYHTSMHVRLKPKYGVVLKQGDKVIGKVVQAEIKKTKVGNTEKQECDLQYLFDSGFNPQADLLQDALDKGIITKKGNLYYYSQEKLGMISKVREWIKDHAEEIRTAVAGHD